MLREGEGPLADGAETNEGTMQSDRFGYATRRSIIAIARER
jgi:hypothetical protein